MSFLSLDVALRRAAREYEEKANFNPSQPRVPRGSSRGGEWTRAGGAKPSSSKEATDILRGLPETQREDLEVGLRAQSREVQQFMERNRRSIERTLGLLQMVGGGAQAVGGVVGVAGGGATSEFGFGIPIAVASAWMVTNGYDNFLTGWRALTTGDPQETDLSRALRRLGLSHDQAIATETLLAGGAGATAARLSRSALRVAAQRELERRTLALFQHEGLTVRAGGVGIWDEVDIQVRGDAWEAYDAARTGFERTPRQFRVFDQFDRPSGTAISNKTLDLARPGYSRVDRNAVYNRLAGYIDRAAAFQAGRVGDYRILREEIRERRLHVLLPSGEVLPGQALQIAAAEQYATQRGVILQLEYAH